MKVELEVDKQSLVKEGDEVTVTLPGGAEAEGRIRSLGRVAHAAEDSDDGGGGGDPGGGGGSTESVLDMTVALSSKKGLSRLDEAPVTVNLASESRKDALCVPITALLAQPGGGYAVEVVDARRDDRRSRGRARPVRRRLRRDRGRRAQGGGEGRGAG